MQLITGSPGGIGGFIDRFRAAGLGSQVASWLGRTDGAVLTAPQVEQALGSNVLGSIASRLGLTTGIVGTTIGYPLPKVIGQMTPGGAIPTTGPSWVSGLPGQTQTTTTRRVEQVVPTPQVAPAAMHVIPDTHHLGRWLIPVLAALGVLGVLWYLLSGVNPPQVMTTATAPAAPVLPPAPAPSVPAHLALSNDEGMITYSGTVHDEATRADIIDSLKGVFGASHVKGDITVDANAGPAPWLVNLRTALENLKTPGVQAVFDGDSLKIGGLIGDADRNGIINSLRSVFGTSAPETLTGRPIACRLPIRAIIAATDRTALADHAAKRKAAMSYRKRNFRPGSGHLRFMASTACALAAFSGTGVAVSIGRSCINRCDCPAEGSQHAPGGGIVVPDFPVSERLWAEPLVPAVPERLYKKPRSRPQAQEGL